MNLFNPDYVVIKPFPTKGYLPEFSKYFSRFPMSFMNSRENLTSLPKHSTVRVVSPRNNDARITVLSLNEESVLLLKYRYQKSLVWSRFQIHFRKGVSLAQYKHVGLQIFMYALTRVRDHLEHTFPTWIQNYIFTSSL